MYTDEKLVPSRRFQGFNHDWEQRELGEITTTYSGGTPFVGKDEFYAGNIPFIRSSEINSNTTELSISEKGLQNSSAKIVNVGDILYALYGATSGEVGISQIQGAINQAILAIKPNQMYDSQFIMQLLRKKKQNILDKYLQGGQGNLSGNIIKSLKLMFPEFNEQKKIGKFFATLDNLIASQQHKLNKIKALKSAYLSEMFPAVGERKPKRRFAGFTDDWEQFELGDISKITMGQSPNSINYTDNPNDYILVQGNADMKNGKVYPRVWTTQITKKADPGDLILSVRAPVGDVGKTDFPIVIGRGIASIKGNEFLFQTLSKMKINGYWNKMSTGSTFDSINSEDIKNAIVMIPTINEQKKIGEFFVNLDNLIASQQQKLVKLQNMKKAYLNEMFI